MSSFYGGKQGRTYHITNRFASISDMVSSFAQTTYSDTLFGEYVIIDTLDKSNPENGCLYRRGLNSSQVSTVSRPATTAGSQEWLEYFENAGAGAIYVGKISGPRGNTPYVVLDVESNPAATSITASTVAPTPEDYEDGYNISTVHSKITFPYLVPSVSVTLSSAGSLPGSTATTGSSVFSPNITFSLPRAKNGDSINNISLGSDQKSLIATVTTYDAWNVGSSATSTIGTITYPTNVSMINTTGANSGKVNISYSDGNSETIGTVTYITSVTADQDQSFNFIFNNGTTQTVPQAGSQFHVYGDYDSVGELPQGGFPSTAGAKGWIATVNEGDAKSFYAYDYHNNNRWYKIGSFGAEETNELVEPGKFITFASSNTATSVVSTVIKENGIWFVTEDR